MDLLKVTGHPLETDEGRPSVPDPATVGPTPTFVAVVDLETVASTPSRTPWLTETATMAAGVKAAMPA